MHNQNIWFEAITEEPNLVLGDSSIRDFNDIFELSIQMVKTGTTTIEELNKLGKCGEIDWPKSGLPDSFGFESNQFVYTTIYVNLTKKVIQRIWLSKKTDIDRNKLNIGSMAFIRNEFLVSEENDARGVYYNYRINQYYSLKSDNSLIIQFLKDYENDDKESFEYFKKHPEELHLFSGVTIYNQNHIKQ